MKTEFRMSPEARYCADTFNGAVAAAALSAAWEIGLLDELDKHQEVDLTDFAAVRRFHLPSLRGIALALSGRKIVELDRDGGVARVGPGFAEAFQTKGMFYWLTRGCGEIFTMLPQLSRDGERSGQRLRRDAAAISVACRSVARSFFDPPLFSILAGVPFRTVADLGCGSADRIITIVSHDAQRRAIGIDIADGALEVARDAVATAGVGERVTLVRDDVLNLAPDPRYAEVDLVTCFLMGHDFWPRENCVKVLHRLRDAFPNAGNLILADTCRSTGVASGEFPLFTLGFELVHSVLDQYLPTAEEWEMALADSGWSCAERRTIDLPAFSFIFRLVPA